MKQRSAVPMQKNEIGLIAPTPALDSLSEDVTFLWLSGQASIPVYDEVPSSLVFLRDHVALSRPCIIRNAVLDKSENKCPLHLTLDDLVDSDPTLSLVVDVTPDGQGDCLRLAQHQTLGCKHKENSQRTFVKPFEHRMSISEFRSCLRATRSGTTPSLEQIKNRIFQSTADVSCTVSEEAFNHGLPTEAVYYYSRQNDCLRSELYSLWQKKLFPENFVWASEAFGVPEPEAVNLWLGNEQAVSSMHKDHYENLFYVLSGEKVFTLCPPADAPFLYEQNCSSGCFQYSVTEGWTISSDVHQDGTTLKIPWISADVVEKEKSEVLDEFPLLTYTHPLEVHIRAGDLLYLPALWFHRVTQSCETVGINYWYDMKFDSPSWCYFHFLQSLIPNEAIQGWHEEEREKLQPRLSFCKCYVKKTFTIRAIWSLESVEWIYCQILHQLFPSVKTYCPL